MSSLRTIFGIVVLAAILYAVYVSITKPKSNAPPADVANGLAAPPQGDLLNEATPQFSPSPSSAATPPSKVGRSCCGPRTADRRSPRWAPRRPAERASAMEYARARYRRRGRDVRTFDVDGGCRRPHLCKLIPPQHRNCPSIPWETAQFLPRRALPR